MSLAENQPQGGNAHHQNGTGNGNSASFKFSAPFRIQVNRRACRFGRYRIPRHPHPSPRASRAIPTSGERPHPRPSLAHPISSPFAHRRPLDQSSHRTRVYFRLLARRGPKWAPTMVSFVATHTKVGSNVTLNCTLTFREIHQWNT